jgi:hypothetical protein
MDQNDYNPCCWWWGWLTKLKRNLIFFSVRFTNDYFCQWKMFSSLDQRMPFTCPSFCRTVYCSSHGSQPAGREAPSCRSLSWSFIVLVCGKGRKSVSC